MPKTRSLLLKLLFLLLFNAPQENYNFLIGSRVGEASHPGPRRGICEWNKECKNPKKKISKGHFSKFCETHLKRRNTTRKVRKKPRSPKSIRDFIKDEKKRLESKFQSLDESVWTTRTITTAALKLFEFLEVLTPGNIGMRRACIESFLNLPSVVSLRDPQKNHLNDYIMRLKGIGSENKILKLEGVKKLTTFDDVLKELKGVVSIERKTDILRTQIRIRMEETILPVSSIPRLYGVTHPSLPPLSHFSPPARHVKKHQALPREHATYCLRLQQLKDI